MSRIGKMPIEIPAGVEVNIDGVKVTAKGPLGTLERELHSEIIISKEDNQITVQRPSEAIFHRSLHGLTRTLISNMVVGVSKGFAKDLEIHGVGYRVIKQGNNAEFQMGYSHPVLVKPKEGLEIEVQTPTKFTVKGIDKQAVGQLAAEIRQIRKPEPYKGKGIRYVGEHVRRKVGKTGK